MRLTLKTLPRKRFCLAAALAALAVAGCGGADSAKPASAERRLDIVHEPCDIESGSAVKTDVNGDGSPDIIKVMSGGREVCRAIDLNFDKVKDAFIYFDQSGNERRRESDFDKDGRPDEVAIREGGVIVSKELETNYDKKLDTWETYVGGKLTKAERDSDGDGLIDEWWDYNRPDQPGCAVVTSDKNQDNQPDPDTAVDMCGEGYKAPPLNYTAAAPTTTTSLSKGSAPGTFTTAPPPAASAAGAAGSSTATAPAPTASATGSAAAPASAAPSASTPAPKSSAPAPKGSQ